MRPTTEDPPIETGLGETLARRRRRATEFLEEIRARTDSAKQALLNQLERVFESVEGEKAECRKMREELVAKSEELQRQTEIVGRFRDGFSKWQEQRETLFQKSLDQQAALSERVEQQQTALDERLAELKKHQAELDSREEELRRIERETKLSRQDFEAQAKYLEDKQNRLNERLAEVEADREELAVLRKRTVAQRRKLASAVKARRAAGLPVPGFPAAGLPAAAPPPAAASEAPSVDESMLVEMETRRRELEDELGRNKDALARQSEELDELVREKIALIQRLEDAEKRAAEAGSATDAEAEGDAGESAAEMEQLKARNLELEAEISKLQERLAERAATGGAAAAAAAAAAAGGAMDWEAQKARLLASLENEGEDVTPEREEERTEIGHVIEQTDAIIAEKDREIQELNALLNERSENLGAVTVGAAAVGEVLDKDEIVAQERERLDKLQKEWEEKLRQAEVQISLERASIAREKALLAEAIEKHPELKMAAPAGDAKGSESARKKWMSALGLSDEDDEQTG